MYYYMGDTETLTSASSSGACYDRPVSALEDPANFNIRHPLQSKWTLWYRASNKNTSGSSGGKGSAKADTWEASLQCVNTVDTIEDFWGMYNNVPGIGKMDDNSDYMFFKEGIRPAWEDPANANGGSFTLQMKNLATGEFLWLNTLLLVVGSMLNHQDKVTGVYYARRSGRSDRISLWISSAEREVAKDVETEWMNLLTEVNTADFQLGSPSFSSHRKETSHRERPAGERPERPERNDRGERSYERSERNDRGYERSDRGDRASYERSDRGDRGSFERGERSDRGDRGAFERRPSRGGGGRGGFSRPSESREWTPRQ